MEKRTVSISNAVSIKIASSPVIGDRKSWNGKTSVLDIDVSDDIVEAALVILGIDVAVRSRYILGLE